MRTFLIVVSVTTLLPLIVASQGAKPSAALHELFAQAWESRMQADPVWASRLGDRRWNDRWPEVSEAAAARRADADRATLARLKQIDRSSLSSADRLNYDLFEREYADAIEEFSHRWYLIPLDQRIGLQTTHELATELRFETLKDYEDWIARLENFPAYVDGTIGVMREGIRVRVLQPRIIVERILGQVDKLVVSDPTASPYYTPFRELHPAVPADARAGLAQRARTAVANSVLPAMERFRTFLSREYLPAAFEKAGIWQMPDGEKTYAFFARKFTTTNLTPQEIHELGLSEVRRIRAQMDQVMRKVGFKGTLKEFFAFLRTDPQFYYKTGDELLTAYAATAKRIDPTLVKAFKTLPRMPYGVKPIPEITAPDTTTAYYSDGAPDGSRAGTFFVNLYKPETRPKYEMMALAMHEAVPGHHLQIALAMEQGELPAFRRFAGYTAFVEGWGLYAESLGDELGLYDDPYAKFGQLTYEMWRAVRLVVDTGMHVMRWDRQKAIDFFLDNAAKSEDDIVNEIDRYIAWPGQALAYKIGELKIKELRARATQALGPRFDLRQFHDVVLGNGAVTLDVLEREVDGWIQRVRESQ
jgi:uncharacterized protein (DUF885 family)